jgi:hypothetical protein
MVKTKKITFSFEYQVFGKMVIAQNVLQERKCEPLIVHLKQKV